MNQFEIEVVPEVSAPATYQEAVLDAAVAALTGEGQHAGAGCTILLTSEKRIRDLNREYLGIDKVTDVLSFPAGEPMLGASSYLGDIAISVPRAKQQADQGGHDVEAELQLLTVHAVLHLLGYDHATQSEKEAMWTAQASILVTLGAEITEPKNS